MKARKIFFLAILVLIFSFSSLIYADVPQMINYQGKITTPQGALVDDTLSMVFTIYDSSTGGNVLWADTQSAVVVEKGVFSVLLGSVNPIPNSVFDGEVRYLGVKVGTDDEMTPRKEIVSVAYAFKSLEADTADYAWAAPSVPDNDWTFRITDGADTTLITGGEWGIARSGNTLYGNADSTHVNLGVGSTTGESGQDRLHCTVGGGASNTASGADATVGGGFNNTASGTVATVGGGHQNAASENQTTVGGGRGNTASGYKATVAGGRTNTASGEDATVGGGRWNKASGYAATVPGGFQDSVAGDCSFAAGNSVRVDSLADYTFAFGNNFTTSTPHAVIFYDADTETKVGVQTTSPGNILTVKQNSGTDPVADAWTTYSSREYKRDIHELTPEEYQEALEKVVSVPVVKFHYKGEDTKEKIGLIAEEAPEEILAEGDNKAISLNEYISLLHAAVKAQQGEIDALKGEIERMKSGGH